MKLCSSFSRRRSCFFFFNDTATTEIYTLSLHDALPISGFRRLHERVPDLRLRPQRGPRRGQPTQRARRRLDRKSTRLNSSHLVISYAVFCLKKKKKGTTHATTAELPLHLALTFNLYSCA